MSDGAVSGEATRRTPVALIALAVLGIVLVLAAVIGMVFAQYQFSVRNNGYSGTEAPDYIIAAQVIYQVAPAVLTGGLVSIGLALAVAALRASGHRIVVSGAEPLVEREDSPDRTDAMTRMPDADEHGDAAGDEPLGSRPLDPEAFKRPRADRYPTS